MYSIDFSGIDLATVNAKIEYTHNGKASTSPAFEINECGAVRILLPRSLGVVSVFIEVFNEAEDTLVYKNTLEWSDIRLEFDVFEHTFDFNELGAGPSISSG